MSHVERWWLLISLVSMLNIGIWLYVSGRFALRRHVIHPRLYLWRRWVFWLSGIYVFVCAFRSFLPRIDLERICLVETPLSSMFIGRAFATVAEMSFIIQVVILLREAGFGYDKRLVSTVSWVIIPLIVLAEISSWYAILTRNYLGSVIEESLWTVAGVMLLMSFIALWPKMTGVTRYYLAAMIIYTVGFVMFMVNVDVPMYWERWLVESARNVTYLGLYSGVLDTLKTCMVSFDLAKWRDEIPWMTLYFTVTVWVSMAFAFAPSFKTDKTTPNQK